MKYPLIMTNEYDVDRDERHHEELMPVCIIMLDDKSIDSEPIVEVYREHVDKWNHAMKIRKLVMDNKKGSLTMEDWRTFSDENLKLRQEFREFVAKEMKPLGCEVFFDFDMHDGRDVK